MLRQWRVAVRANARLELRAGALATELDGVRPVIVPAAQAQPANGQPSNPGLAAIELLVVLRGSDGCEALADAHLRVNNGSALELDTDDATAVADLTALADVRLALDVAHVLSESEQQAMRDAFISRQSNDCDIKNVGGCDAEG